MNANKTLWLGAFTQYVLDNGTETRVRKQITLSPVKAGGKTVSKRDAMRLLQPFLDEANKPASEMRKTIALSAFLDVWERDYLSLSKRSTQGVTKAYTKRLRASWGARDIRSIGAGDVQSLIVSVLKEGNSPQSVKNLWRCISCIWTAAFKQKYVDTDGKGIKPKLPRVPRKKAKVYMLADVASMIVNAQSDEWRVFYWLAAEAGLRSGELAGLRLTDIDLEAAKLTVNVSVYRRQEETPKTDSSVRVLALSPQLVSLLRGQIERQRGLGLAWLFTGANGQPWDMDAMRRFTFKPMLKRLGISGAGFHAFRHFNVSLMDGLRVPLRTIQERIGHAVTGVFTLDVYGGQQDFARNMEAARLLGAEIERAKLQLIYSLEAQVAA